MTKQIKPLLACEVPLEQVRLPVYVSTKLDGIRCLIINGVAYSRSLKPIRNKFIQSIIGKQEYNGLDGELIVGNVYDKDVFQKTTSGVMSEKGEPTFTFYVFDDFTNNEVGYSKRLEKLLERNLYGKDGIITLHQELCTSKEQVDKLLQRELELGGEGLILRSPNGKYKFGRSTPKEQLSVKLKFFEQQEYKIVDVVERMHNANEARVNEMGYTERSSHKDNMIPMNTFGAFVMELQDGRNFNVGSGLGLTDAVRKEIWNNRDKYIGKIATVRQMKVGSKNGIPRLPTFVGLRDKDEKKKKKSGLAF